MIDRIRSRLAKTAHWLEFNVARAEIHECHCYPTRRGGSKAQVSVIVAGYSLYDD